MIFNWLSVCFYTGCDGERWGDQEDPGGGPEDPAESGGAAGWGEGIYTGESGKWGPTRDGLVHQS